MLTGQSNPKTALYAIITILITTSLGQPIILYVAALGNVPKELLEASEIDGATKWQVFTKITWPLIKPTTLYIVVVTTINSFQIFALIQLLTAGGLWNSTIMYLVYEAAIKNGNHGVASAIRYYTCSYYEYNLYPTIQILIWRR